ncbi:MAG: glycosyltransferase, partial [Elusimicrobiales bacterium]
MKIIQLITRLDKGGSSENVIDLSTALFKKGFDVVLIYGAKQRLVFPFVSYYIKTFERDINPIKDFLSFLKILLILIKEKPDIVHTHTSKAGFIGRWACWLYRMVFKRNLKIIHTPHGHIFYGYFGRFKSYLFVLIERVTSIITDVLVALTENERKESLEYGVGKQDKWVVIPSGIDYRFEIKEKDLRRKLNIEDNKIIVGSVMRLEDIKGDIYFVLAAGQVLKKSSDIFFILVGDGKNRK